MPVSYRIDPDQGILFSVIRGRITAAEMLEAQSRCAPIRFSSPISVTSSIFARGFLFSIGIATTTHFG